MPNKINKNGGQTTSEAGEKTKNGKQLIKAGYQKREHYWYKRNKNGTVLIPRYKKSKSTILTAEDQPVNNKNIKQEANDNSLEDILRSFVPEEEIEKIIKILREEF